jgi:hypothetical protein
MIRAGLKCCGNFGDHLHGLFELALKGIRPSMVFAIDGLNVFLQMIEPKAPREACPSIFNDFHQSQGGDIFCAQGYFD